MDNVANSVADEFRQQHPITETILKTIAELYQSAKVERTFKNDNFDCAYHSPITGELEFFISRLLYHYSNKNDKGFK